MGNLTVPYGDRETPWSFASRLAARNGRNAREFCLDWETRFQAVVNGERDAIGTVARFAGVSPELLAAHSFTRIGRQGFEYRGQRLDRRSFRFGKTCVCPACLKEDVRESRDIAPAIAVYQRAPWMIDAIKTCPVHDLALVQVAHEADIRKSYDFALCIGPAIDNLLKVKTSRRRPSVLEYYIIRRLDGARQSEFLDSMALFVVIATCVMVGAIDLFGRHVRSKDLSEPDRHEAGGRGFEIVAAGSSAIEAFLDGLHTSADFSRSGLEGPSAIYGRLYRWLASGARDPVYDPVREIVGRHVRSHLPLAAGFLVFGKPVERRMLHSVRSLSMEAHLHPKRLRRVLRAAGIIGEHQGALADQHVVFAAEAASSVIAKAREALSLPEAAEHLNAPRVHAALLAKNRFIEPHVDAGAAGARDRFAVADLDAFLRRLLHGSASVHKSKPSQGSVPVAAKAACCSAAEIIRLVFAGELQWTGHLIGTQGYLSLLVDINEIRMHVRGPETGGISLRRVASMLETNDRVVRALINKGAIETFMAVNPVNRCPQVMVRPAEIARFQKTYISLYQLARKRHKHIKATKTELKVAGVKPAFDPVKIKATFYLRSDLTKQVS